MQKVLISPNVKTTKPIPIPIMSKGYHQSLSEDDNVFEDKDKVINRINFYIINITLKTLL